MPYLNLDLDYFTHPKTSRLVGLLGRGAAELPIRLWAYCGKHHSESGNLTGYSAQEIETVVGWWGGTGKMVEAMLNVGFLDKIENGFRIHGWKEHAGHLSVFKKRAKSAAKERWKKYARSNASSNAQDEITNAPYHTLPDHTKPKKKVKHCIQPDFAVSDGIREWAKEKSMPDPDSEVDQFKDHYSGNGATKLDWEATFRTWLRNAKKWSKPSPNGQSKEQAKLDSMRRNLAEAFPEAT